MFFSQTIFVPPIPENIAFSFYAQGSKLSFAVYHTSVQGKSSGYFKHSVWEKKIAELKLLFLLIIQVEANVPSLADLLNQLSFLLLQLQQLRDKVNRFV